MRSIRETIHELRQEYKSHLLAESEADKNPVHQFEKWFQEALAAELPEPNSMTLATCTLEGKPSARIVLLKGFDEQGFTFFTNYNSRKGIELAQNPFATLVFYWGELERQVRIEGKVEKVSKELSENYFHSRPRGSQIGALVSPQSEVIADRKMLEEKWKELNEKFAESEIPMPEQWGGYLLRPDMIEFWQGRPSRLHDRLNYTFVKTGEWKMERLAP